MKKRTYHWELKGIPEGIIRFCHNCGKKAVFIDTGKRRRNANGKTIYEYAIYKCGKDHTWNRKLGKCKPSGIREYEAEECDIINIKGLYNEGVNEIEIILGEVPGKCRIDRLLKERIKDHSLADIRSLIDSGHILLDGKMVKWDSLLKNKQTICIMIDELF